MIRPVCLALLFYTVCGLPTATNHSGQPVVDLDYAKYQGVRLEGGVDEFLGMRYASPPIGELRFRAPRDPSASQTLQSATEYGPICIGVDEDESPGEISEDCLFINVFKPSTATSQSRLPVWFFIQGGGYAENSNANYNGTQVIQESGDAIVFVTFNYRVGALGFLASEQIRQNGDLNAGLLDQRKALRWVKQYIEQFGGDPDHIVIHGVSAGAGSVAYHLSAYGGKDEGLFIGAIVESSFWPTQRKVSEMEFQFERFVNDTDCSAARDSLDCLRKQDIATIQKGNTASPFPGGSSSPLPDWYFLPVTDGNLVQDELYNAFDAGNFIKVPVLVGDDTDEGSNFAYNASSSADVSQFFKNNYPSLNSHQLDAINQVYPRGKLLPRHAAYFGASSAAYGDATFTCPGNHVASSAARYLPDAVWNYRVNIIDESNIAGGIGVPHTFELPAIFGAGSTGTLSSDSSYLSYNAAIIPVTMHYFISFVQALNPNTYRYAAAPEWSTWGDGRRLRLQTNNTAMEAVPPNSVQDCAFWKSLSVPMERVNMAAKDLTTREWINALIEPGYLLVWALRYYVKVNLETVFCKGQILAPLLHQSRLRDEAFGKFWVAFSTYLQANAPASPPPTQPPDQIIRSSDLIPPLLARASGTVLDVGPGTGTQMPLLRSPAIKAIYGAEPCHGLHAELRTSATSQGLEDKYNILPCGVESADLIPALQRQGLLKTDTSDVPSILETLSTTKEGVFDTIVCVRVLCSVPDMHRTVQDLYTLLRPGGKMLVVEHVVNPWRTPKGSVIARAFQAFYGFMGWSWYLGNCCMNRDTTSALKHAADQDGGWESVELESWFESTPMPYVAGILTKRR
ncbi:EstA precursor [Aspergillus eucalypticola CBS 122712]|uniref:EstA n=1 Tax=Aspergillus eucalypticola (strain CBS 122712 / IBT 29274) TaxID=1448314 RepID=A0A317WD51_ASPEC|nr:EstA precursor [Aspergillus eucalypticola CBS 122712]PWY84293.1 EstA precursor [Aspergillus eucalypticola CBS 122712]